MQCHVRTYSLRLRRPLHFQVSIPYAAAKELERAELELKASVGLLPAGCCCILRWRFKGPGTEKHHVGCGTWGSAVSAGM